MYTKFLESNGQITKTRKTYDRALKSLPLCQHYKIWPQYIDFINASGVPMLGNSVFRRYIELVPEDSEVFVNYLVKNGFLDEASEILINLLNKQSFSSKYGKSKYELWIELCQIICNSARQNENREFDADKIFRQGIKTYSAQVSLLFNQLANYYIHRDLIPKAQAVYEEALGQVKTVKDFTEIYDVYVQFLESLLTDKLDKISKLHDNAEKERLQIEIEHMMAGLEHLLDSNQLMINEVRLRQDPHSVPLWLNRFGLLKSNNSNKTMLEEQFEKSLNIIDIEKAVGDPSQLFIEMANYYFESHNSLEKVRNIFERGVYSYRFIKVQHLSNLWSYWIEFEIKNQNYDKARELIKKATSYDSLLHKQNLGGEFNARLKIHRDLKLWTLYADFEEHFGTFTSCKAIYDHMLDFRIATMSVICNYAVYLLENQYYEESFRIYERGISLFKWPYSYQLWREYLANFE
ncbi:MAG: Pre-mRNA-splicing factor SYF1, partial [Paramarteilia canceri]